MGHEIKNLYRASYLSRPQNKSSEKINLEISRMFRVINSLLILRIIFSYFDVLPQAVHDVLFTLSYPLLLPFSFAIGLPNVSGQIDWIAIFALAFYATAGYFILESLRSNIVSSPAEEAI